MSRRSGSADLPLHGGRVPAWLGQRMTRLGAVIVEAIVLEYGRDELLRRLAHPFWFQSFGAVMGMDWHSSGITTSVIGALKRGLAPLSGELGLHVCGGRGRHSRETPAELIAVGDRVGLDARTSQERAGSLPRLTAPPSRTGSMSSAFPSASRPPCVSQAQARRVRPSECAAAATIGISPERRSPARLGAQHRRDGRDTVVDHVSQPFGEGARRARPIT